MEAILELDRAKTSKCRVRVGYFLAGRKEHAKGPRRTGLLHTGTLNKSPAVVPYLLSDAIVRSEIKKGRVRSVNESECE
jgi:hypothetical protein